MPHSYSFPGSENRPSPFKEQRSPGPIYYYPTCEHDSDHRTTPKFSMERTPHESLPLPKGTYRQYFRLVTSDVNVWYSKHSTPNPLGIKPGKMVKIVDGDKFAMAAASSSAVGVVSRAMAAMGLRAIN